MRCLPPSTDTDQPTAAEPIKDQGTLDSSSSGPAPHPGHSGSTEFHVVTFCRRRLQFLSRSRCSCQHDDVTDVTSSPSTSSSCFAVDLLHAFSVTKKTRGVSKVDCCNVPMADDRMQPRFAATWFCWCLVQRRRTSSSVRRMDDVTGHRHHWTDTGVI